MSGANELPTTGGVPGIAWFQKFGNAYQALDFLVRQIVAGKTFVALVQVKSVTGGGIAAPAIVSVQPMVEQIDGLASQTPHGIVYGIPCFRLQGGVAAAVIDPVVGDIGLMLCCDRDISVVKATGAVSGPGSWRQNDWADGCYLGSLLGHAPTQYVQVTQGGMNIVSTGTINISAASIVLNGIDWSTHVHSGVVPGGGDTGPPV